jgi:hypothetical protein
MPTLCAPVKERRAWTRTAEKVRVLVNDPEDALDEPYPAWVVDHSPGGVRLAFESSTLQVGNELSLQPTCAVFPVEVRVRNRRRRDGRVELGCEFVQPNGERALMMAHWSARRFAARR